jgi:Alkylmercury lyase
VTAASELDRRVRLHIYEQFLEDGRPPTAAETGSALGLSNDEAVRSYHRLADRRVIVLEPGTVDIWMANPLSARPTPFRAEVGARWWYGACIWDALGILAMVRVDGTVRTACPDCDEPLVLTVSNSDIGGDPGVAHFAVPAARWWDDIGYT